MLPDISGDNGCWFGGVHRQDMIGVGGQHSHLREDA